VTAAPGWYARVGHAVAPWDYRHLSTSYWVALSSSEPTIDALAEASSDSLWQPSEKLPLLWTDDHASVLSALR